MKRLLALIFLLFVPMGYASIEHMSTTIDVSSSDAYFRTRILFSDIPEGVWEYPLLFPVNSFEFSSNFGGDCDAIRKPFGSLIRCEFPETDSTGRSLILRFKSEEPILKYDQYFIFKSDVTAPDSVGRMVVDVFLDRGMVLIDEGSFVPFSPLDGEQGSDGKRIFVLWERNFVPKSEGLSLSLVFEKAVPESDGINTTLLIVGLSTVFLIAILVILAYFKRSSHSILKKDEEKIVKLIKEKHGMAKQNDLVKSTGFSKAKVSRLLKDMEGRNLIHTKHIGRNNEVYLGKGEEKVEEKSKDENVSNTSVQ